MIVNDLIIYTKLSSFDKKHSILIIIFVTTFLPLLNRYSFIKVINHEFFTQAKLFSCYFFIYKMILMFTA